ncbi:MAG: hypothetical protein F2534_19100 [Actinobacteria bacterium]|uniref:Unannotated protein n=1 Tax=freshwater metagenome TaxID=449393 RepID=A0A6J6FPE3_9ZZZZ|nr:hypothetical protein [Actinomycetota bacterium]
MRVFHSSDYCATDVAFDTTRKADAIAVSLVADPIPGVEVVAPTPATIDELLAVHSRPYVRAVLEGRPHDLAGSNGLGWDTGLARAVLASTGGVRDAALWALQHRTIAGSLSSGLHHARHEGGRGYCTVNGLVVGAKAARTAGARRVLILDLDAHCGGGTASLIDGVEGIEQIDVSVNSFDRYDDTDNARLFLAGSDDYLQVVRRALESIRDPHEIDLVLYNAGMDPCAGAGGPAGIDAFTMLHRERMVFSWSLHHQLPVAWVLAGGYTISISMEQLVGLHRVTIDHAAGAVLSQQRSDDADADDTDTADEAATAIDHPTTPDSHEETIHMDQQHDDHDDRTDTEAVPPATPERGTYSVRSEPPEKRQKPRFSQWSVLFDECRADPGEWRKAAVPLSKSTAMQFASDLRNAHKRAKTKARLKGLLPGERWDAQWGEVDGQYFIWLCFLGRIDEAA